METVIIVIHLMVIVAMVAMVLLQRSEGGALGIGGGGGFMTSRGQGNVLTRSTAILAAAFFATSILLTILARLNAPPSAILDTVPPAAPAAPLPGTTTPGTGQGILDTLEGMSQPQPGQTPPAPTTIPDGTSIPTTPIVPPAPTEPQVPSSQ
jgi:preprotein translocase subunit SecG